ncbi:MAG: Fur family transcriptional regulator [Polyangia bacterium]
MATSSRTRSAPRRTTSPARSTGAAARPARSDEPAAPVAARRGHSHTHETRAGAASSDPQHQDHDHDEQARILLRERGLRITGPRVSVLKALLDTHRPTSAQELIDAVPGMDYVTVYRTLNTLVEEGIAQSVGTSERGRRFEVHACEGCRVDHPHLECRGCGSLQCLEYGLLPAMLIPTEVGGFLVEEAKLYLYGWCAACQARRSQKR